jgi:hypothetical protein
MWVTSIAAGASLNTRPDVSQPENADYNATAKRCTITPQRLPYPHSQCICSIQAFVVPGGALCAGVRVDQWGRVGRSVVE